MSLEDVVRAAGDRDRRRSRRAKEKRRKRRRRRSWLVVLVSLLVVGGAVGGAWLGLKPIIASMTAPDDWTGDGTGQADVVIPPGSSGQGMAMVLANAGVVKTAKAFTNAYSEDPRAQGIQSGTYRLRTHMSAKSAVGMLLDKANRLELKVTIPEGKRATQILDLIAQQTGLSRAVLDEAAKNTQAIGLPDEAKGTLEGYLFPATYIFTPGVNATDVLRKMIAQEQAAMGQLGVTPDKQRDLLVEASLVQAEAGHAADMPKIARVLDNRMAQGIPLGLDTTVHYATGKFTLSTTTKDTQIKSPYNTYSFKGLPVGPICSPGVEALKAVLDPAPGPWLYFTTVNPDTGETKFATTLAEKAAMDAEWDKWKKAHPGQ
ncbi:MAG TPA: endolytic transglycosylase MltG [Kineosporiaceae bacterium]|nr:endolytic transglycosylase MltG [Kineosporiaceae bacterium]